MLTQIPFKFDPANLVVAVRSDGSHVAIPSGFAMVGIQYAATLYIGNDCDIEWLRLNRCRFDDGRDSIWWAAALRDG